MKDAEVEQMDSVEDLPINYTQPEKKDFYHSNLIMCCLYFYKIICEFP